LNVSQVGVIKIKIHLIDVEAVISVSEIAGISAAYAEKLF
jgi:hypothetical protein